MKPIDLGKLQSDPVAAAFVESDKDLVAVTGFVCSVDNRSIGVASARGSTAYTEYPRDSIISAYSEEDSEEITLLVDANARVRTVSIALAQAGGGGGGGVGACCNSLDGQAKCCCGVGQRCRSLAQTCVCEDASRPVFPGFPGFPGIIAEATMPGTTGSAGQVPFPGPRPTATAQSRDVNWVCRTERGYCPIVCYPIIVDGKVVDWWCYCDCTRPIPVTTQNM